MGAATALSRGFGFVRILVIAAVLGTTFLGNTYSSSNSVSNVLFELLASGALSAVLVPTFVSYLDRGDQEGAEELAGGLLGIALIVLAVVAAIGIATAPLIARLLTSGVHDPHVAAQQRNLSTFLLYFFIPQIVLYAVGAVAVAALYAQRRLAVTAIAPIGLTVVVVTAMGVFRALAGPDPGLSLDTGEKLVLALGGTLGVAAFVGIPAVALWRGGGGSRGFRLVPRFRRPTAPVRALLRLSGWAAFQNSMVGVLLLAAIVIGNRVEGGTVAYQVSSTFFLAPYAVLAQPIHTAIHPDLARQVELRDAFARSLRWALDSMALLVVPVSAGMIALSQPIMRVAAFGHAQRAGGVALLSAGLATFGVGLFVYSAFLLFVRAYYALGEGRTPAMVALVASIVGVGVTVGAGSVVHGATVVAVIGLGHSLAYAIGALVLGVGLARHSRRSIFPSALPKAVAVSAPLGVAAWWIARTVAPTGRIATLALLVGLTVVGGAIYILVIRLVGGMPERPPHAPGAPDEPDVVDLEPADIGSEEYS
jgi:putative peptidoglycan lipid II flippase